MNDSLKYKAALFLIDNMEGHESPYGNQIERFKSLIENINTKNGIRQLYEAWNLAGKEGGTIYVPDSTVITSRLLISNIDAAFESWQSAPWKDKIDFSTFCNYILPYRCSNEHIGGNWRMAMQERYAKVIAGESDMQRAFAKIKDAVFKDVVLSNAYCPFELDAITIQQIGKAECGQRAILLTCVLRALGIPSAIDFTPVWADYSNKSHSWVSAIDNRGVTYTVYEQDSIAKSFNPIDASMFIPRYTVRDEDNCPYDIKRVKTPVKVYREEYAIISPAAKGQQGFLSNIFIKDVSDKYGLTTSIVLDTETDKDVYLCTYVSAKDWMPVMSKRPVNGKVRFDNIGNNVVCTAFTEINGQRSYISQPFLIDKNGIAKFFAPNVNEKTNIQINRKYPLCQYIADVWGYMRGGCFLASNDPDFNTCDTLAVIKTMPFGITKTKSSSEKKYRYFRYKAPDNNRTSLSELQFLVRLSDNSEKLIQGSYSGNGLDVQHLNFLHDNNSATSCRAYDTGYTITVDLGNGKTSKADYLIYAPSTDLNFVEKGHLYELYYFDTSWKFLGRQIAQKELLEFKDVPSGAILLLKDKTTGQEERIFEYKNGVQIWH